MSLILDALNRSQRERDNGGEVPGIETQHWVEPQPYSRNWQRSLPWLALLLALGVIAWLVFDGGGNTAEQSDPVVKMNTLPQQPGATPAPAVVTGNPAVSAPPPMNAISHDPATAAPDVAVTPRGKNTRVADLYRREELAKPTPAPVPATAEPAPVLDQGAASEQLVDIEKMINMVKEESENAELAEHSAPFLSALSQQAKDQVPTIYYTRHDYSSTVSQSTVTLNGKIVRAGGSVAGKIKLEEILPNSIVLSYRGTEFRLRALNSWINL